MSAAAAPLAGLRVIDFTLHAAGPFCTQILTALGAQCIKIETMGRLDIFRKPHPVYGRMESATFDQVSAGKLSIRLNLKDPRGVDIARQLVAIGDIVAESFRPGVMQRLGLDYETLSKINPSIVMVSVSAAGQTGPESRHAGYAPLFSAAGGLGALTGYEDGPPVEIRHVMDHSTGLAATNAVLAACITRQRTGRGQHVDVAAREVAISFIGDTLLEYAVTGQPHHRQGNDVEPFAPHNVYPCHGEDNWVSIAVGTDEEWRGLVKASGFDAWLDDPRFSCAQERWKNRRVLDEAIARWTSTQDREAVTARLQAEGVPAFPSYTSADIVADRHLRARGSILDVDEAGAARRTIVGAPWLFEQSAAVSGGGTPKLGEHNEFVFGELLGLPPDEIAILVAEKVIW